MQITEIMKNNDKTLSFEIFPPKTDAGLENLFLELEKLSAYHPDYVSVTYGAGGSTRDKTLDIALEIQKRLGIPPLAHFTCVGSDRDEIKAYISRIHEAGINNILALRGDPPSGQKDFIAPEKGFAHANELVSFLRNFFHGTIAVAGYPEGHVQAPSLDADIDNLHKKITAGADFIVTQLFFDNADFFRYQDKLASKGIDVPVIPGIMPITGLGQITRSVELSGARIPVELRRLIDSGLPEDDFFTAGCDYTLAQCRELSDHGVKGFHFYTLNKSEATGRILDELYPRKR